MFLKQQHVSKYTILCFFHLVNSVRHTKLIFYLTNLFPRYIHLRSSGCCCCYLKLLCSLTHLCSPVAVMLRYFQEASAKSRLHFLDLALSIILSNQKEEKTKYHNKRRGAQEEAMYRLLNVFRKLVRCGILYFPHCVQD